MQEYRDHKLCLWELSEASLSTDPSIPLWNFTATGYGVIRLKLDRCFMNYSSFPTYQDGTGGESTKPDSNWKEFSHSHPQLPSASLAGVLGSLH